MGSHIQEGGLTMWEVREELKVQLPPGFFLKEDEDFVYLFQGEGKVATFSSRVNSRETIKAAERRIRDD